MKKILISIFSLFAFIILCSHDMFLKFDSYFLEPNKEAVIQLFNGTFEKSDNVIDRNRMTDVGLVGNGKRTKVDSSQWFEKDSITFLKFKTGEAGTWIAGVSTAPRSIELAAEDFNKYLKNDGVLDVLEHRKATNTLNKDAIEKYSKHVKTIFQVGNELSDDWSTNLGYPIEFIPLKNPYEIHPGHSLPVKLLRNGQPLANHLVYVGHQSNKTSSHNNDHGHSEEGDHSHKHEHDGKTHSHGHKSDDDHEHSHDNEPEKEHSHKSIAQLKTNADGIINVDINNVGVWYLRTIHMVESKEDGLTHESNWATLTFAIGEGHEHNNNHNHDENEHSHEHGSDTHTHDDDSHEHHHDDGFPSYIFWIASFVLIAILFFLFNRKKS